MKLKLIKASPIRNTYSIGFYTVDQFFRTGRPVTYHVSLAVEHTHDLPRICYDIDYDANPDGSVGSFTFSTMGMNGINENELIRVMDGYKVALKVQKILTDTFLMKGEPK